MPTNVLLVRYARTWTEVTDATSISANGRKEAMLALGAIQTVEEAQRVAARELAFLVNQRTMITVTQDDSYTSDANTPYLAYKPGDTITVPDAALAPSAERVIAITVDEDDNGELTFVPELKDLILAAAERFEQDIRKMNRGNLGGSNTSSPYTQV